MEEQIQWQKYCAKPEAALSGNAVKLLKNGDEAFSEMLQTLRSAEKYILMEFYAFADDSIGRMFREILVQKAASGVKVYLIYDAVGSILTDRDFFLDMARAGVHVLEFRPVAVWAPHWNWLKRDHRKMVCVDGRKALVGGFNITSHDAPVSLGGRGWKDTLVGVEGRIVNELEKLFWTSWAAQEDVPSSAALDLCAWRSAGEANAEAVSAAGFRSSRSIRRSYGHAIDQAYKYIYITNAYFLPDKAICRRLIKAARRGVDVRILAPYKTDHPYVRLATWAMYRRLIRNGIKVYEWQGEILHSKTAVIDGIWSSVGSHNLDHWSLYHNLELNINIYDRSFGSEMAHVFHEDLENSRQITIADVKARSFGVRLIGAILYFLRSWL